MRQQTQGRRSGLLRLGVALWLAMAPLGAQQVPQLLKSLEEISGLKVLKPIKQERMRRTDLKSFFEKRMREAVKPEETRLTELALKKLGLVPADFNLARTMVDLLSEQAAAFYDYENDKMVMLDGSSGALEEMALVHELAHALADQHFRIERFLGQKNSEDETSLARQAVVEGQAQWLMSEYMARQIGQSLLKSPALANLLSGAADPSGQFPVYDESPLYLRESLIFPYAAGMRFQQAVIAELGVAGFRRVFEQPPANSHEVLHPELYLRGTERPALPVKAPQPEPSKEWKLLATGTVGEFDHQMLLKIYAPDRMELSVDWRAGEYSLWEHKKSKEVALGYAARWGSAETARQYLAAYRRILEAKFPDAAFERESETGFAGTGGGGAFSVRLEGDALISLEGPPGVH